MLERLAPKARGPLILATALAALALLGLALGAGRAEASQVQAITLEDCPTTEFGCQRGTTVRVDQATGLIASFNVTNSVGSGGAVFVELPEGASFKSLPEVQFNYKLAGYSTPGRSLQSNRLLRIPIPPFLISSEGSVTAANKVELMIGVNADYITLPPVPGPFTVNVSTTSDVEPRASSAITATLGLPATIASAGGRSTTVATEFTAPTVVLKDSRGNAIPDADLTFEAPNGPAVPSGTFEGPLATATGKTNSLGIATPSLPLTANNLAGDWQLQVTGPSGTEGSVAMTNLPGAATEIELEVEPTALMADGSSEAEATIWVRDQFDNLVTTDEIGLESEVDGPDPDTPVLQIDGSYEAHLTASTVPGEYTVTATDASVNPALTDSVTVIQDELPATGISLALSPPSILADGSSTTTALIEVENLIGGPVVGEDVAVSSSGGNSIGSVVDHGDGTYSALITSTTAAGPVTITATDISTEGLKATAVLTQTALPSPPPPPPPSVTPPSVRITSGPKGKTRAKKATFKFATTSGSAAYFECKLDKGRWARCKSPRGYAVKPGPHTFRVRAVDGDGSPGPVAKRSFKRLPPK